MVALIAGCIFTVVFTGLIHWLSLRQQYTDAVARHPELAGRWPGGQLTPRQATAVGWTLGVLTIVMAIIVLHALYALTVRG